MTQLTEVVVSPAEKFGVSLLKLICYVISSTVKCNAVMIVNLSFKSQRGLRIHSLNLNFN